MHLKNLEHICCTLKTSHRIRAGTAHAEAITQAAPGNALADAFGYASGRQSFTTTMTRTSVRSTHYSSHSSGHAGAHAYATGSHHPDSAHAVSFSRYRTTSTFSHISATTSFSKSVN